MTVVDYARHSRFTDPGRYGDLLAVLPTDIGGIAAVVRNLIVHYRAGGVELAPERLAEIDNRWVDRILDTDQARFPQPLAQPRPYRDRVAGCCRDFTLLTVAALRQHGIPARSRIGFARYFFPERRFNADHVVVDWWDGAAWHYVDAQLDPAQDWGFDPLDLPRIVGPGPIDAAPFLTAAQVWTAYRRGEVDPADFGIFPGSPIGGPGFIRNYVIGELAHRQGDELLLWDVWGAMAGERFDEVDGELDLIDEVATMLLAADAGDLVAEAELRRRYLDDDRLHPDGSVTCYSPTGTLTRIDLETRKDLESRHTG